MNPDSKGPRNELDEGARAALKVVVDGGAFDWLRKLGANDKLAFVASGMGAQLAAYAFRSG